MFLKCKLIVAPVLFSFLLLNSYSSILGFCFVVFFFFICSLFNYIYILKVPSPPVLAFLVYQKTWFTEVFSSHSFYRLHLFHFLRTTENLAQSVWEKRHVKALNAEVFTRRTKKSRWTTSAEMVAHTDDNLPFWSLVN